MLRRASTHWLRHTSATHQADAGNDIAISRKTCAMPPSRRLRFTCMPKMIVGTQQAPLAAKSGVKVIFQTTTPAHSLTPVGGSRYESGRNVPMPAQLLLALFDMGVLTDDVLEKARKVIAKAK